MFGEILFRNNDTTAENLSYEGLGKPQLSVCGTTDNNSSNNSQQRAPTFAVRVSVRVCALTIKLTFSYSDLLNVTFKMKLVIH